MTLAEAVKEAVERGDAKRAGRIANRLRAEGATYRDVLDFAQRHTGIDPAAWDALMYEADAADSEGS